MNIMVALEEHRALDRMDASASISHSDRLSIAKKILVDAILFPQNMTLSQRQATLCDLEGELQSLLEGHLMGSLLDSIQGRVASLATQIAAWKTLDAEALDNDAWKALFQKTV